MVLNRVIARDVIRPRQVNQLIDAIEAGGIVLTDAAINAAATTITGNIARATYNIFDPSDPAYGAVRGTGVSGAVRTANVTAFNAAAAAALAADGILVARGTYEVTGTITAKCHAEMGDCILHQYTAGVVTVRAGSTTPGTVLWRRKIVFPHVLDKTKSGLGWTGTGVGVEIATANSCQFEVPYISQFPVGLLEAAYGQGNVHNTIMIGHLENNQVNNKLYPADTGAWVNENTHVGGRFEHTVGQTVAGTRQVLADFPVDGWAPDNNVWYHASLESTVAEFFVDMVGNNNLFDWCRWEGPTPLVTYRQHTGANITNGQNTVTGQPERCLSNHIRDGYNSWNIVVTESANSWWNDVTNRNERKHTVGGGTDFFVLENLNDTAEPALVVVPAGTGNKADPSTVWVAAIGGRYQQFRAAGDTFPRLQIDGALGNIKAGPGNAALDATFQRFGTLGWYSDKRLVAQGGFGTGNSVAATTPGSVVRKMEVFDENGASLGFVAIYASIT